MISRDNLQDLYPLAPMQEGMLFHWLMSPDSNAYCEQVTYRLRGVLDTDRFETCWNALARRHEVLRTVFVHDKAARPLQMVLKSVASHLRFEDLRGLASVEQAARMTACRLDERRRGFDLTGDLPSRITVLQLANECFEVVWTFHHIILDGWSVGLLMSDLLRLYAARHADEPPVPYSRYIRWLEARDHDRSRAFWRESLEGYAGSASIPSSRPGRLSDAYAAAHRAFAFEPVETAALERLAREHGVTTSTLVHGLWAVLLSHYQPQRAGEGGAHDLVFGAVVSGRPPSLPGVDSMVGLFTNTIALRVRFEAHEPFSALLAALQDDMLASQEHAYLPLAEVQTAPGMVDHIVAFENYPRDARAAAAVADGGLGFHLESVDGVTETPYDLNVVFEPGERLLVTFYYNASRYAAEQIDRLFGQLRTLAGAVVSSPHACVGELDVLPETERSRLRAFTATRIERAGPWTIHETIACRMRETPDAPAVVEGERVLSYAQLGARAARLSSTLRARLGLQTGARVAVVLERGADIPACWLAILRAGGVYVPIDPSFPDARLAFMVEDSGCAVVLTDAVRLEALQGLLEGVGVHDVGVLATACGPLLEDASADELAYIIYTSGSTGTPKGVGVGHRGVLNVAAHMRELQPIGVGDRVVSFASPSFDASIWEMCVAFCHGAALVIADRETVADPARFGAFLRRQACTVTLLPPSYIRLLASNDLAVLKLLATGGEATHPDTAARLSGCVRFVNLYGPTEASILVTSHVVAPGAHYSRSVPIGAPIPNVDALVLDRDDRLAPVGAPGELCVGGDCVALGYLQRPALTAERFRPHPLSDGQRLYRTGDLVRWLDDGTLEFLGRIDEQVKIRGFRVELGEIQASLLSCPGVRQAGVILEPRDAAVVAYVAVNDGVQLAAIREHLRTTLPEPMIPSRLITLNSLPLTPQGKLDRGALPTCGAQESGPLEAPRDALEADLLAIWRDVLNTEQIGIHDSFFDLGGHSLIAVRLAVAARKALGQVVEVRDVFHHPTIAGLAAALRGRASEDMAPITRVAEAADYDVSHAQRRLWLLHHLSAGTAAYNIAGAFSLDGSLDSGALERACAGLIARHEALRTLFTQVDGQARQRVCPLPAGPVVEHLDVSAAADPQAEAVSVFRQAQARPFDLERGPLLRILLIAESRSRHLLVIVLHHIVADGWSVQVMLRELSQLYASALAGTPAALEPLAVQHRDVIGWLNTRPLATQAAYWHRQMAGALPVLELPTDRPRPRQRSFNGATRSVAMPLETVRQMSASARAVNVTTFMVLVAAVKVLLARYTGQRDIIVGYPSAGREHPDLDGQVGFFVNTVALRDEVRPQATFSAFLADVRRTVLDGLEHQDYPFDRLVEDLGVARDPSRHPIFDVMVAYHRDGDEGLCLPGLAVSPLAVETGTSKFDLLFAFTESGDALELAIEYSSDLFEPATIERIQGHLLTLLAAAMQSPETAVGELELLTVEERRAIRPDGMPGKAFDPAASLVSRIDRAVAAFPDATAVVSGSEGLTYRQLDARATALAVELAAHGAGRNVPIGLCIDRGTDMLVGMLGILKAGSAYLPLDPSLPSSRLLAMIADAKASVVVSHSRLAPLPTGQDVHTVCLDRCRDGVAAPMLPTVRGDDLAYVMYTSGSTGRPNGVLVEHRNVLALLDAFEHLAPRRAELAGTTVCPFGFDVSVWEIFSCLCAGGTLHVLTNATVVDAAKLTQYLRDHGITSAYLPPAIIDDVAAALEAGASAPLDRLLVGVEPIRQGALARLQAAVPGLRVVNGYGPTETTVCATFLHFDGSEDADAPTPIGRAARDYEVHLLDALMQPVPVGVPGEIYVGGAGLTRGYAGNAVLTAQRFVPDPFARVDGARLYRTGDLACRLADGNIRYLGRLDVQVKLRGFRIEPGEIESVLRSYPAVSEAVVVARDASAGGKQLVAYVSGEMSTGQRTDLKAFLKERLPDYMVPAVFVALPRLPRTVNGKVDREALPPPPIASRDGAPPLTSTEALLQALWCDVLRVEGIGCEDDFFELGGHSLLATRLLGRLHEACGVELPLRALFDSPTVRAVAAHVDAAAAGRASGWSPAPIVPANRDATLPLSFAQQRLWFLEQLEPGSAYNVPVALELNGALDPARLAHALNAVIARHECLRTRFVAVDGMPEQQVLAQRPVAMPLHDLSALDAASREDEARSRASTLASQPFDLGADPLVRAVLLKLAPQRHRLVLSFHHIVVDGWSMGILMHDLGASYMGAPLAPLAIQYADFAAWQRDGRHESALAAQLAYWRSRLSDAPQLLTLPTDRPRTVDRAKTAGVERFVIEPTLTTALQRYAREQRATTFMVALAALNVLLARLSAQQDISVGTPIANRTRAELEPLIGFFANTVVVRVHLEDDPSFAELVGRVREAVVDAFAHQDAPFEQVVDALAPVRSLAHAPLFQVLFIMQNAPLDPVTLPALEVRALDQPATTAKFDLTVAMEEREGALVGAIEYDADLFDAETIRAFASQLHTLIATAVERPQTASSRLPLLSPAQRLELIARASANAAAVAECGTVTGLVAAQVLRTPQAVAIEDGAITITYAELDARANRLAHYLRALGAGPGVAVGLCVTRSADALVALLAILRSGACVVPLDPGYPAARLLRMLQDAAAPLLVGSVAGGTPGVRTIDLDRDAQAIADQPESMLPVRTAPDDLLYLLFTSGSTGVPKGVMVPHRVIANLVAWGQAEAVFEAPLRTLQFTSLSFDVSFQEIFTCWACGGTLVVVDEQRRRDSFELLEFLRVARIERIFLPFVALQGLAEAAMDQSDDRLPTSLQQVITAGEQLRTTRALVSLFTRLEHCELHNHYGPTETHVLTAHQLKGPPARWPNLPPIGRPVAGARLYVLDAHMQPVPCGVAGELFAGGIVVSYGYVNRAQLTAERFVSDPFVAGAVLYRTGDRVRLRADGRFEFLGRTDAQLKIRGFRVEPGEIEAVLTRYPQVAQAAVGLDRRPGPARLVAHVVPVSGATIDVGRLRDHLLHSVPEFMVPAAFAVLPALPLTPSGKVDRQRLANVDSGPERNQRAPRSDTERSLVELFAQLLELPTVAVDDSFFDLGGHSLLATRLASRVRQAFGVRLALRSLFEAPTVERLARVIDESLPAERDALPIVPVDRTRPLPLSFAQERLWYLDRMAAGSAYNMPAALRLSGQLDVSALQGGLDAIVHRHEVLRTRFVERRGVPAQIVDPPHAVAIRHADLTALDEEAREAEVRRLAQAEALAPFVLSEGPLLRVTLLRLRPREHVLIIVLHHILADGWSIATMTRELVALYAAAAFGRPASLAPLLLQYGDFACWQRSADAALALTPQREYWARQLAGAAAVVSLPVDHRRVGAPSFTGAAIDFAFDATLSEATRSLVRTTGTTLHATLLAAFATLLFRTTGQEDLTIGTPVGHRPRPELEALIGLFLNLLPIRVRCEARATVGELCRSVQALTLDAFAHGDLPFEQIVEAAAGGHRAPTDAPLFNVLFVMQNAPRASLELPGMDVTPIPLASTVAKYDLTLVIEDRDDVLCGALEYASDIFDVATATELAEAFVTVVRAMVEDPDEQIIGLPLGTSSTAIIADEEDFQF